MRPNDCEDACSSPLCNDECGDSRSLDEDGRGTYLELCFRCLRGQSGAGRSPNGHVGRRSSRDDEGPRVCRNKTRSLSRGLRPAYQGRRRVKPRDNASRAPCAEPCFWFDKRCFKTKDLPNVSNVTTPRRLRARANLCRRSFPGHGAGTIAALTGQRGRVPFKFDFSFSWR